jgi:hypothetical protein
MGVLTSPASSAALDGTSMLVSPAFSSKSFVGVLPAVQRPGFSLVECAKGGLVCKIVINSAGYTNPTLPNGNPTAYSTVARHDSPRSNGVGDPALQCTMTLVGTGRVLASFLSRASKQQRFGAEGSQRTEHDEQDRRPAETDCCYLYSAPEPRPSHHATARPSDGPDRAFDRPSSDPAHRGLSSVAYYVPRYPQRSSQSPRTSD